MKVTDDFMFLLKAMKAANVLMLTLCVFQSIEREEPIEVDPAPTNAGLENGHAATTGNYIKSLASWQCMVLTFRAYTEVILTF